MGNVLISRRFDFSSSHRYYRDEWSEEENTRVFGDDVAELFFGATYGELPNAQIGINSRNGWCDIWHQKGRRLRKMHQLVY